MVATKKVRMCMRWCFLLFSLVCMAVIFVFSAQDGLRTSAVSGEVTQVLVRAVNIGRQRVDPNPASAEFQSFHHLIRKIAHFSIFCLLAVCVGGFFGTFIQTSGIRAYGKAFAISLGVCFLYACSDEVHQAFIAGRGPSLADVMIDTSGALVGLCLLTAGAWLFHRRKRN